MSSQVLFFVNAIPMTVMKNPFMKNSPAKPATPPQDPKPAKRDNIFSKSRDTREDRGAPGENIA